LFLLTEALLQFHVAV